MTETVDLRPFGYAPGDYMIGHCRHCNKGFRGADKRAWNCKPCALEMKAELDKRGVETVVEITPRLGSPTRDQLWATSMSQRRRIKELEKALELAEGELRRLHGVLTPEYEGKVAEPDMEIANLCRRTLEAK